MIRALLIFGCTAMLAFPAGAADKCPLEARGAIVSLESDKGVVTYHHHLDKKGLARLRAKNGGASLGGKWSAIGYTVAEMQFRLRTEVKAYPIGPGGKRVCAVLSGAEVQIGYPKLDVYVNSDYMQGTCQFRSVLAHEHKHVDVFRNALAQAIPKLERVLKRADRSIGIITARDVETAANRTQRRLHDLLKPHLDTIQRLQKRHNGALDTRKNYRKEQESCSEW